MPNSDLTLPVPVSRDAAKHNAELAIGRWVRATMDDAAAFAASVDVHGPDRIMIFAADTEDAAWEDPMAELTEVVIAGPEATVTLTRQDEGPWADAVLLWSGIREAQATSMGASIPVALVLAVDDQLLAGYEGIHCPTHGPTPVLITEVAEPNLDVDPFAALLEDVDGDLDVCEQRIDALLERYALTVPSIALPYSCTDGAGDCDDDMRWAGDIDPDDDL